MEIGYSTSGSFKNIEAFLKRAGEKRLSDVLNKYGREGVRALSAATPKSSGRAASSWDYIVKSNKKSFSITWTNSDVENGFPVAIMLQYGYATGTGGYVKGRDYINPVMKPIFDRIASDVWKEVTSG